MAQDHFRNLERGIQPALTLAVSAAAPLMAPVALLCLAFLVLRGILRTSLAPFGLTDDAIDHALVGYHDAGQVALGAAGLVGLVYLSVALTRKLARGRKFVDLRLLAALVVAYPAAITAWGPATGTHPWSQLAYSWSHPRKSAVLAWGCPASVASGEAEKPGRFNLMDCQSYVDEAAMTDACWQVMRRMATMRSPEWACTEIAQKLTGLWWPNGMFAYTEWVPDMRIPVRNPPLATPELMRKALERQGLTPR